MPDATVAVRAAELTGFGDVEIDIAEPAVGNLVDSLRCGVVSAGGKPGVPVGIGLAMDGGGGHEDGGHDESLQTCSHREVSR